MSQISPEPSEPTHHSSPATDGDSISPVETIATEQDGGPETLRREVSGPPYSSFSERMKMWMIILVSVSALISPFGGTTYYPALNVISDVLDISPTKANLSVTTYMIAQSISPAIIAGMSDNSGRRLSFLVCFLIFIAGNIGLALQTNYAALLILRVVQAVGCSAALALSVAVAADLATSAERGRYLGYATAGILFGPAFGPTIGGVLAQYLGWRSIFWFLAIYGSVLLVLFTFLMPETCRNVVGNGSIPPKGVNRSLFSYLEQRRRRAAHTSSPSPSSYVESSSPAAEEEKKKKKKKKFSFPNPLATLRIIGEKESCIVLIYNGLFFTGAMMLSSALPNLLKTAYGLNELEIGLCYISMGTGSLISSLTMGHVVDWNFRRHAARLNLPIVAGKQQDLRAFPIERIRLQIVAPGHVIGTLGLIAFGWTIRFQTHIAWPEVALFFVGFGVSTSFNITNTLLIDLHKSQPATATSAVNLVRCLMSAGGSAAIIPMCDAMNPGWAFTLLGLVYLLLIFVVFWVMKCGMQWRQETERKKLAKEAAKKNALAEENLEKGTELQK